MDYLAAMNMNLGFALVVEKLIGMQVPEKAIHLRVLIAELDESPAILSEWRLWTRPWNLQPVPVCVP